MDKKPSLLQKKKFNFQRSSQVSLLYHINDFYIKESRFQFYQTKFKFQISKKITSAKINSNFFERLKIWKIWNFSNFRNVKIFNFSKKTYRNLKNSHFPRIVPSFKSNYSHEIWTNKIIEKPNYCLFYSIDIIF